MSHAATVRGTECWLLVNCDDIVVIPIVMPLIVIPQGRLGIFICLRLETFRLLLTTVHTSSVVFISEVWVERTVGGSHGRKRTVHLYYPSY